MSIDFSNIYFETRTILFTRLHKRLSKFGEFHFIDDQKIYGNSKQVRWLDGYEILPIGYIQHKNPMNKLTCLNKYDDTICKKVKNNINKEIFFMQSHPISNRSVKYNINRVNKYFEQKGKCYILNNFIPSSEINCHHILPRKNGGGDDIDNLVIIHENIHKIVHMTDKKKIDKIVKKLKLTSNQIKKINNFRSQCKLDNI